MVGILDLGANSRPGGGHIRTIANLANVVSTHYYIHNVNLAKDSCFEVRKDPMIYNYGGKPYTTSTLPKTLNMFKRVTSGGPTLGIDCSGYVFSALATAGLKMDPDPNKILKADLVRGIPSGAFKEPQSNGLRCLQKISLTKDNTLQAGDIIAINGHVVMVDSIGADPFGLKNINKLTGCNTTNIKKANFDFVISQSAPIKNGIGINKIQIRDYLSTSGTIHDGLIAYALASCRLKFGASANLSSPNLSIVRHNHKPECLAEPLTLTNAECVDSCPAP